MVAYSFTIDVTKLAEKMVKGDVLVSLRLILSGLSR